MSSEIKEMNAEETVETVEAVEEVNETVEEAVVAPVEEKHVIVGTGDFETRISDEELAKKKRRKEIWDKITTGILIFLMSSPILILAYIFIWFLTK